MLIQYLSTYGVSKKPLRNFRKAWMVLSKTVVNSKISCISTSFKNKNEHFKFNSKKVTGLTIFFKTASEKKDLAQKNVFSEFFYLLKTA